MLPVDVARSFSHGVAIRYVLPVLSMASRYHTTGSTVRRVHIFLSDDHITAETTASMPTDDKDQQAHIVSCHCGEICYLRFPRVGILLERLLSGSW